MQQYEAMSELYMYYTFLEKQVLSSEPPRRVGHSSRSRIGGRLLGQVTTIEVAKPS
jgi:hypothetical protein